MNGIYYKPSFYYSVLHSDYQHLWHEYKVLFLQFSTVCFEWHGMGVLFAKFERNLYKHSWDFDRVKSQLQYICYLDLVASSTFCYVFQVLQLNK